ncbi:MAG: hypothetical protein AB7S48_17360 [Bacteroidales bacterium]
MESKIISTIIILDSQKVLSILKIRVDVGFLDLLLLSRLNEMDFYNACGYLLKENLVILYRDYKRTIRIKLSAR